MGNPRRQLAGIVGDLHEPEFPLPCGACPVDTPQVMEAVSQAAAGGAPTVLVAMRIDSDARGRQICSDVPVAVIVSPEDFRRLVLKSSGLSAEPTLFADRVLKALSGPGLEFRGVSDGSAVSLVLDGVPYRVWKEKIPSIGRRVYVDSTEAFPRQKAEALEARLEAAGVWYAAPAPESS